MIAVFDFLSKAVEWALTLYLWMMIISILLTWVNPDPGNPIVAFLSRLTAPLWAWANRLLPARLRLFSAYIALLFILFLIEFLPGALRVLGMFAGGVLSADGLPAPLAGFFLRGVAIVLYNFLYFLILILVVWFAVTLVNPALQNPVVRTLFVLVDPIITPLQRRLPRTRVDFSPLLAAAVFLLINWFAVTALMRYSGELVQTSHAVPAPAERRM